MTETGVLARGQGAFDEAGEIADALMNLALVAEGFAIPSQGGENPGSDVTAEGTEQVRGDAQDVPARRGTGPEGRALAVIERVGAEVPLPHSLRTDPVVDSGGGIVHHDLARFDQLSHEHDFLVAVLLPSPSSEVDVEALRLVQGRAAKGHVRPPDPKPVLSLPRAQLHAPDRAVVEHGEGSPDVPIGGKPCGRGARPHGQDAPAQYVRVPALHT